MSMSRVDRTEMRCSFCGMPAKRAIAMFSMGVYNICGECVMYCYDMLMTEDVYIERYSDHLIKTREKINKILDADTENKD